MVSKLTTLEHVSTLKRQDATIEPASAVIVASVDRVEWPLHKVPFTETHRPTSFHIPRLRARHSEHPIEARGSGKSELWYLAYRSPLTRLASRQTESQPEDAESCPFSWFYKRIRSRSSKGIAEHAPNARKKLSARHRLPR
ncbi:hypothetical protein NMY22_g12413 [Coprinellus aureogranulatus]|nr:hypothetical protein NMY22_g12413 [Coprinellus aureogranulatus]